jgi:uncharacterized protein YlxW (UPF0749 family)
MSPDFLSELFSNPLDPGYGDAAARRAERGPDSPRRRLTGRVVATVVALAIGLLFAVAYRQTLADEPRRSQARADLVAQIRARETTTGELRTRADTLREDVAQLRDQALGSDERERLRELEAATGLRRVTGDGVVVTLKDAPTADEDTGDKPNLGKIFDRDLQAVANALWSSGAEAIAINDQRLSATTTIRKAGGAIMVDLRPVTSPYEVKAIGPDDLEERFSDTGTARLMRGLVDEENIGYDVRQVDDLELPAATEPRLDYARGAAGPMSAGASPAPASPGGTPSAGIQPGSSPGAPSSSPSGGGP